MPKRCVVAGCGKVSNKEKGVSLHIFRIPGTSGMRQEKDARSGSTLLNSNALSGNLRNTP